MEKKVGFYTTESAGYVTGSAVPVVVYGLTATEAGTAAWAIRDAADGDEILGDVYEDVTSASFPQGIVFPNGCYLHSVGERMTVFYSLVG